MLLIRILFICFWAITANAQLTEPYYRHFGVSDGVPSTETYQVFQDSKGFIWVSTDRGVVRYNGVDFELFNKERGLLDNVIFYLYEDVSGRIWFVSLTGNLAFFDGHQITVYKHNHIIREKITGLIRSIHVSKDDILTLGTQSGICTIQPDGQSSFKKLEKKSTRSINFIDNTGQGIVYQGRKPTSVTLNTNICWNNMFIDSFETVGLKPNSIRWDIQQNKRLFFSLFNTVYFTKKNTGIYNKEVFTAAVSYVKIIDSLVWVGVEGNGIHAFDFKGNERYHLLDGISVSSILKDHQRNYWFSTLEKGVFFTRSLQHEKLISTYEVDLEQIESMGGDDRSVLMCDRNSVMLYITPDSTYSFQFNQFRSAAENIVYNKELKKFYITGMGHKSFDPETMRSKDLKYVSCGNVEKNFPYKQKDNDLSILGGIGKILIVKNDTIRLYCLDKDIGRITSIYWLENGEIILGTINGVYRYKNNHLIEMPEFKGVRIVDIKGARNQIFIASRGNGLFVLEGTRVLRLNTNNGLASDELTCLHLEKNAMRLWIGTIAGLQIIDGKTLRTIQYYSGSGGLIGNNVYQIHVTSKTAYVATEKGVSIIKLPIDFRKTRNIPFYFLSYTVNSERYLFPFDQKEVVLEYGEQLAEIEFSYLDYSKETMATFEYLLDGYSKTWVKTTTNKLQFIGIPPGKYTLLVKNSGNGQSISVPIHIKAPYWQQTWFTITIGLIILSTLFTTIYLIYLDRIRKQKLERETLILQQTALTSQMNPHFIFNSLNSIQGYIFKNRAEESTRYLSKFSKLIRTILDSSFKPSITLSDELKSLELYIALEKIRLNDRFQFRITNTCSLDSSRILVPPLILQPFVENAIWHGISEVESGKLDVLIYNDEHQLYFVVDDNGIGRDRAGQKENFKKSRGASISEQRMKNFCRLHRGQYTMSIIDKKDNGGKPLGTRVEFSITLVHD